MEEIYVLTKLVISRILFLFLFIHIIFKREDSEIAFNKC